MMDNWRERSDNEQWHGTGRKGLDAKTEQYDATTSKDLALNNDGQLMEKGLTMNNRVKMVEKGLTLNNGMQ